MLIRCRGAGADEGRAIRQIRRGRAHNAAPTRFRRWLALSLSLSRVALGALALSTSLTLVGQTAMGLEERRTKRERFAEGGSRISTPAIDAPRLTVVYRWASKERRHDDRAQQRVAALDSASQDCGSDSVESRVASLLRGTRLGGVQAPIKHLCPRPSSFALGVEPFGEGHGCAAEAEAGLSARLRARAATWRQEESEREDLAGASRGGHYMEARGMREDLRRASREQTAPL